MRIVLVMMVAGNVGLADEKLPEPTRETLNCSADGSLWPYLVQLPEGEPEAVLVYLHGHYSDEYQGMTTGIYNDAFGKLRRECLERKWAYVTAWYGGNTWMGPIAEAGTADLLELLRERWPGRPVYLSGGSMGGTSALIFAVRRPELIDGLIARCPAGDMEDYYAFASAARENGTLQNIAAAIRIHYTADGHDLKAELKARSAVLHAERLTMPVHIVHGSADATIPVDGTRRLAERLRELGREVQYVEIEGGGHDAPVMEVEWGEGLEWVSAKAAG